MIEKVTEGARKEIKRLCSVSVDSLTDGERLIMVKYLEYYPDTVLKILEEVKNESIKNL